jgi:hypothetical protein
LLALVLSLGDRRELAGRISHSASPHGRFMRHIRFGFRHPFGTIKSWMGSTHFQMKILRNVSTEMALARLAHSMKRVMRILGVGDFMEAIRAYYRLSEALRRPWRQAQNPVRYPAMVAREMGTQHH